jgi:FMN-dependent NADH-azoreductase
MAKLLYIEASPRKERSSSIAVAGKLLGSYSEHHPKDEIEILDLWSTVLPEFGADAAAAKFAIMHGEKHTDAQKQTWRQVEKVIEQFKSADKYLFSVPMWNFSIPYKLKHYIDLLVQPGYTFSFSPQEGYKGLVTGKPAVLIYARGGDYSKGTPAESYDQQTRYLEQILGFIGFTKLQQICIESTMGPAEAKLASLETAKAKAQELGATL